MDQRLNCRHSIIEALALLSSADQQVAYERNVPYVTVTNELLSTGFDDEYLPESRAFRESFSAGELDAMAEFDQFFDQKSKSLPDSKSGVSVWLKDENWQEIMRRASILLDMLRSRASVQK